MWRLAAVLAVAALAWSQGAASAPVGGPSVADDYQQDIDGLGVIARLQGHDITAKDALSERRWSHPFAGEPKSERAHQALLEMAMASVRQQAIASLVPALVTDCQSHATPADLAAFFPFWRAVVSKERDRLRAMGESDPLSSGVPLATLNRVSPATPGAEEAAKRSIRMWRLFSCAQTTYRSEAFTTLPKAFALPYGEGLFPIPVQGWTRLIRAPAMNALSPSGSLTRLFRAAEKEGMLSFPNSTDKAAFYRAFRTTANSDSCFNDVETATAYFATPPWRGTVFPPRAKPAATLREPFAGSPAFVVDVPTGWTACRDEPSVLYLSSDKGILALTIFEQGAPDRAVQSELAAAVLKGAGFPPSSRTEASSVAGASGTAFISSKAIGGRTLTVRVIIAPLDATHVASEVILPITGEDAAMTRLLTSVRLTKP